MSKRHKHKHNYKSEHMRQNFITEEQLLILILIILAFRSRPKPIYDYINRCKYCSNDKCKYNSNYDTKRDCGYSGGNENSYNESAVKTEDEKLQSYSSEDTLYNSEPGFQTDPTPANDFEAEANDDDKDPSMPENNSTIVEPSITETHEKPIQEFTEEKVKTIITHPEVNTCTSTILQYCPNDSIEENLSPQPGVSKIPVILSQPQLQIPIETISLFPEPVFQIKTVDKRVFLDSCKLIPGSDRIFVKGYIREDIEYCTADSIKPASINGNIKKILFTIPFECSSKVSFNTEPQIFSSYDMFDLEVIDPNTNNINLYEKSQGHIERLNEKVFAELDSSKILETYIQEEIKSLDSTVKEVYTFERIRKKIILNLRLSLMQNQKIFIYNPNNNC
jgi:hypothetical protein